MSAPCARFGCGHPEKEHDNSGCTREGTGWCSEMVCACSAYVPAPSVPAGEAPPRTMFSAAKPDCATCGGRGYVRVGEGLTKSCRECWPDSILPTVEDVRATTRAAQPPSAEPPGLRALARAWKARAKMYRQKFAWESDRHHTVMASESAATRAERATRALLNVRDDELTELRARLSTLTTELRLAEAIFQAEGYYESATRIRTTLSRLTPDRDTPVAEQSE